MTKDTIQFTDPQVLRREYQEVEAGAVTVIVPKSLFVIGGEYKDEPDVVIEVHHAIHPDGTDASAAVAQRIANLLAGA